MYLMVAIAECALVHQYYLERTEQIHTRKYLLIHLKLMVVFSILIFVLSALHVYCPAKAKVSAYLYSKLILPLHVSIYGAVMNLLFTQQMLCFLVINNRAM